ncbi:MAG: hypothetical protein EPN85_05230 [Bacteroidetes bacterium]|nr:MAG: hypothetical protein EPN85_05230 [Bacteroidota bacterium]
MLYGKRILLTSTCLLIILDSFSQTKKNKHHFYFSWGYNKEWYTTNNIRINQPSLGNDYRFVKVKGVDKPGWNTGVFNKALTIPQYNYRLGYYINDRWAVELNFDHTKYQVPDQALHITGIYQGRNIDSTFLRTKDNLTYQLNNGANFFLFNAVRRINILGNDSARVKMNLLLKGGIGFVLPHVENKIMGQDNKSGFQYAGLDAGTETGVQITFYNRFYLEFTNKAVYAMYRNLNIYEGRAKQNLTSYELILSAGVWF